MNEVLFDNTTDSGVLPSRNIAHLHAFVESIKSAPTVSDAAARMYRLFLVLYNVALRYIEFRTSQQPGQTPPYAEMDEYLAALGLPAPVFGDVHHQKPQSLGTDPGHGFIGRGVRLREDPGIVNLLLDYGSDINTQSFSQTTPLICAAKLRLERYG